MCLCHLGAMFLFFVSLCVAMDAASPSVCVVYSKTLIYDIHSISLGMGHI